jgi:small subunit ribosomal protein S5
MPPEKADLNSKILPCRILAAANFSDLHSRTIGSFAVSTEEKNMKNDQDESVETANELEQRVVSIKRTSKVQKGGRRFQLSALVAVGDHNGRVGIGMGKSKEVPDAIRKGEEAARRALIDVPLKNGTIPHQINMKYSAGRVMLKPASPGTGVIAGEAMRAVLELAGVKDIFAKCMGTNNPLNVVKATMKAIESLNTEDKVCKKRGVSALVEAEPVPDAPVAEMQE